jgi:hypothetical protein
MQIDHHMFIVNRRRPAEDLVQLSPFQALARREEITGRAVGKHDAARVVPPRPRPPRSDLSDRERLCGGPESDPAPMQAKAKSRPEGRLFVTSEAAGTTAVSERC